MSKWEMVKLEDICELITDGTHQTPIYCEKEEGFVFLSSKNVTSGSIDWDNIKYIPPALHEELHKRLAPRLNDILLAKNGTTGVAAIVDRECIFDIYVSLALLRPKEVVFPKYLLNIINSPFCKRQFNAHLKGIGVPNLHLSEIRKTTIPLPPLETQKKIAQVLDQAKGLIDLRKAQLEKLDLLVKSQFIEMFGDPVTNPKGWERVNLAEVSSKITDGTHHSPENFEVGEYKYITAKNISKSGIKLSNITYVSKSVHEEIFSRCNPSYGDILYIKDGATTGIAQVNPFKEEFSMLSSVALIKPNPEKIINYYVREVLNNKSTYKSVRDNMSGGGITRITLDKIKKMEISLPPLILQQKFASFVEKVEEEKNQIQESLGLLERNYRSLMQKCFAGELFQ